MALQPAVLRSHFDRLGRTWGHPSGCKSNSAFKHDPQLCCSFNQRQSTNLGIGGCRGILGGMRLVRSLEAK